MRSLCVIILIQNVISSRTVAIVSLPFPSIPTLICIDSMSCPKASFALCIIAYEYRGLHLIKSQKSGKKYGFKDCDKIILYVGRIDEGKGIYELIGGFKKVLSEESNARLVIAGDGAFSLALKKACPNWMQMCFTGFVTQATLYDLYAISDIGVVPSFHEEFGYVAVEMASAKLPVLVNPIGGLKEIAADIDGVHAMEDDCEKPLSERIANGIISTVSKAQECSPIIPRKYLFEEFKERMITLYHNVWDGHG